MPRFFLSCCAAVMACSACLAAPEVGDAPPPLDLEGTIGVPEGVDVSWESLGGKVVLLEFWATWCGPCIGAIPHLNELAAEFEGEDVRFISITDEDRATVEGFLARTSTTMESWIGLDTDGSMLGAYGVRGIPHTVLVGKEGRIAAVTYPTHVRASDIRAMLRGEAPTPRPHGAFEDGEAASGEAAPEALYDVRIAPAPERPSGTSSWKMPNGVSWKGTRLEVPFGHAHDVNFNRVELPEELRGEAFDVRVRVPARMQDELRAVLAEGLARAFGVTARVERRSVEALVLGAVDEEARGIEVTSATDGSSMTSTSRTSYRATNSTIEGLAVWLEERAGVPVFDETGAKGKYDITLEWDAAGGADALLDAVREQLGIEVERVKREVRVLVVE